MVYAPVAPPCKLDKPLGLARRLTPVEMFVAVLGRVAPPYVPEEEDSSRSSAVERVDRGADDHAGAGSIPAAGPTTPSTISKACDQFVSVMHTSFCDTCRDHILMHRAHKP